MKKELYKIKYWQTWLLVWFFKVLVLFPYKIQMRFGAFLVIIFYPFLKRRRAIAMINIKIAFPDLSKKEQEALCKKSFISLGYTGIESIIAWFMSNRRFNKIKFNLHGDGVEYLKSNNQGYMILGGHFLSLEIVGRYVCNTFDNVYLVYQKNKNPVLEYIITKHRNKYAADCLDRKNLIPIVRVLKKKYKLWYAPDQDLGINNALFVPFFGKKCVTLTATSSLLANFNAKAIPSYNIRRQNLSGYDINMSAPWEDYPSKSKYNDALCYNKWLESIILKHPDQYLWQHRRYKTRPEGENKIY